MLALDARQVVRAYPAPGSLGVDPNYLAHVEFDRPDLPWLFTPFAPAAGGIGLAPWLALVVLADGCYEAQAGRPGFPPVVRARCSELQPLDKGWAFAHAQVLGPRGDDASVARRLTDEYRLTNLSRLLCPRRLLPGRGYLACVVPAFDAGRRAALGEPGETGWTLGPAWTRRPGDADTQVDLPVLYSWSFATGLEGDFEALAARLVPRPATWPLDRRVDMSAPWPGAAIDTGRVQLVAGPLVAPWPPDAAPPGWSARVTEELRARLNEAADRADREPAPGAVPVVGPPLYGGVHAGRRRVPAGTADDWFSQLNLRPGDRIAAGLGGQVVRRDQETLMQAAWTQLGDLEGVNALLRGAQVAQAAGASLYRRHVTPLPPGDLVQLTRPVHGVVTARDTAGPAVAQPPTVTEDLARSTTAEAAATPAFRRLAGRYGVRPAGPTSPAGPASPGAYLTGPGGALADFRRRYDDSWMSRMPLRAAAAVSPAAVEQATGQPGAGAGTVFELARQLATVDTLADAMTKAVQHAPVLPEVMFVFPLEQWVAERNLKAVQAAVPADPAAEHDRATALLAPLAAIAKSADPATARAAANDLLPLADAVDRGPAPAALAAAARESLDKRTLVQAVTTNGGDLLGTLGVAEVAEVAKVSADPPLLVAAIREDQAALAQAAQDTLDLHAFEVAAAALVEPPVKIIVVGTEGPTTSGEVVVIDTATPGVDAGAPTPPTGEVTTTSSTLAAESPAAEPAGYLGAEAGEPDAAQPVAFDDGGDIDLGGIDLGGGGIDVGGGGIDVGGGGIDVGGGGIDGGVVLIPVIDPAQVLDQLDLPAEQLAGLAGGNPDEAVLAKLAIGCLDESQLVNAAREFLPDDILAGLLGGGFSVPGAERLANGCFEEPDLFPDPIVEAVLAWLARKQLPPDDVPDLCGLDTDMQFFINNYLHVHQPLPTIQPPQEAVDRLRRLYGQLVAQTWPATPPRPAATVDVPHLLAQLNPAVTVPAQVRDRVGEPPEWLPDGWLDSSQVRPLVAAPVFTRPMYQALLDADPSWLLPGFDSVAEPDLVTVVAANPRFVEAFLVGLNHEMSRELLWRGYPSDPRGTNFRRFWSGEADELAAPVHALGGGPLGSHLGAAHARMLVLVVRGELVRRHPELLVMALRSDSLDAAGRPVFGGHGAVAPIVFTEHRAPDILLVGFELAAADVSAVGTGPTRWWFVLAEHPSAPRFGLDVYSGNPHPADRDALAWNHFTLTGQTPAGDGFLDPVPTAGPASLGWGKAASDTAHLLLQDPVRAVFDAWDLIRPTLAKG